jgi:hypothetical protein
VQRVPIGALGDLLPATEAVSDDHGFGRSSPYRRQKLNLANPD